MMQYAHADTVYNKVIDFWALMVADMFKKLPKLSLTVFCPVVSYFRHFQKFGEGLLEHVGDSDGSFN